MRIAEYDYTSILCVDGDGLTYLVEGSERRRVDFGTCSANWKKHAGASVQNARQSDSRYAKVPGGIGDGNRAEVITKHFAGMRWVEHAHGHP
jgi:hypothetical protein